MFAQQIIPHLENYFKTLDNKKVRTIVEYSVRGGKCIRGFIIKHIIQSLSDSTDSFPWEPIVAIELIHAASLIVDDLPCMDNDKRRRGKPSTFMQFGKHEAILFSFYIISESMKLLSSALKTQPEKLHFIIEEWCELLGKNLVLGQLMDLKCDVSEFFNINKNNDNNENIIKYKTCSLFSFAFVLGALFVDKELDMNEFKKMGKSFGMMFQLVDDYKDVTEDDEYRNYILKHGNQKSLQKYMQERAQLITLLTKNELLTSQFRKMIATLDAKFLPHKSTNAVLH